MCASGTTLDKIAGSNPWKIIDFYSIATFLVEVAPTESILQKNTSTGKLEG